MYMHNFTYNGVNSLTMGVYILDKDVYDKPSRNIEFIEIPGKDSSLIVDNGGFGGNVEIQLKLRLFVNTNAELSDSENFNNSYNAVVNWLMLPTGYVTYTDSYDTEHFRLATVKSGLKVTQRRKDVADITVTFSAQPYRYLNSGTATQVLTASSNILTNPENYTALPRIRVYSDEQYVAGAGKEHLFAVNGKQFKLIDINGYIDIDSEMMNAYKGSLNKNKFYVGDGFPILEAGDNTITLGQYVSKIGITPHWRAI